MKTSKLVLAFVGATAILAQTPAPIEKSVARGEWQPVLAAGETGPVSQFLRGHALLANGAGDQALCRFARLQAGSDLAVWDSWTREFAARHPQSPTANYLRGDAFARAGNWDAAASAFDKALAIDRRNILALNARGVVRTIAGSYDAGLLDFMSASGINPTFADAYINRGYLYVQRRGSATSAMRSFESALALKRGAVLAVLGRGQSLVAQGRPIAGLAEIERAPTICEAAHRIAEIDRDQLLVWTRAHGTPTARGMSREEAGNTLLTLMKDVRDSRDVKSIERVMDFAASSDDSTIQNKTKLFLQSMEKTDKQMAEVIGHAINEKKIENETLRGDLLKQGSQTASSEAEVSLRYKGNGLDIGGSAKAGTSGSLKDYTTEQLKLLDKSESFRQELNSNLQSGKQQSGGAETFLIGSAIVERGDAPRIYHNTLLYRVELPGKGGGK